MEKQNLTQTIGEHVLNHPELFDLTTDRLITNITVQYHLFLNKELPVILDLMLKVLTLHGENHPELFKIHSVFGTLKTGLEGHLIKEEVSLFPKLRREDTDCKALIERLEKEHDGAVDTLHKLIDLTYNFVLPEEADANYCLLYEKLKDFIENMYKHIDTENNVLFKRFT